MSNERKPMLSDEEIGSMIPTRHDAARVKPNGMSMQGCRAVRDHYESLITSGKLRVVDEIDYIPADTWACYCTCARCGYACSDTGDQEPYPFCPGCGNKIKVK